MNIASRLRLAAAPRSLRRLALLGRLALRSGAEAVLVGGPVRDALLGRRILDLDVSVSSPAAPLLRKFLSKTGGRLEQTSPFLTFRISFSDGTKLDVATARKESYARPAVLPAVGPSDLLHDLARRDFTVNAIAADLVPGRFGHLIDPLGGESDLKARRLRALHMESFRDDPTRIFRAARYCGRLGLRPEPETARCLRESIRRRDPALLSPARLRHEWERTLLETDPRPCLRLLQAWKALRFLHPGWRWRPAHVALLMPRPPARPASLEERLFAWGVPLEPGAVSEGLKTLEFPASLRSLVDSALDWARKLGAGNGSFPGDPSKLPAPVWKFLKPALPPKLCRRIEACRPFLTGTDLLQLGVPPGPQVGRALEAVAKARWSGRLRSREDEIRFVIDNFPTG